MTYLIIDIPSVERILFYSATIIILYFSYKIIKVSRSEIPGPFLGKLTSLYASYYIFKGQLHTKLNQLHLQYGSTVQFAPNFVSMIKKEDIDQLYNGYMYKRSPLYDAFNIGGISLGHITDKKEHYNRKMIIKKIYNSKNIRELEAINNTFGQEPLIKKLTEMAERKEVCDLYELIYLINFDIIAMIGFGKYLNEITTQKHDIGKWLTDGLTYLLMIYTFPITKYFGDFFGKKGFDAVLKFCRNLIEEDKINSAKKNKPYVLNFLKESLDPETGKPLPDNDIQAEMVLQMAAGIDTITSTTTWTIKTLLNNPGIMKRVICELDLAFPAKECLITTEAVKKNCPFLEAVIYETMRIFSPTLTVVPRVVPKEGACFSGHYFPPGMECSYAAYAYHRSPLHWDNPDVFNPDRFMGPEGFKLRSKVLVFLQGSTVCPGREIAWVGIILTVANILRKFSIITDELDLSFNYSIFMLEKSKGVTLPVRVATRNN